MRLRAALVTAAAAATAIAGVTFGAGSPPTNTPQPSRVFAVASYSPGAAGSTATANPDPAAVTLAAHDTSQVGPTAGRRQSRGEWALSCGDTRPEVRMRARPLW
jgi:hypothetical protein